MDLGLLWYTPPIFSSQFEPLVHFLSDHCVKYPRRPANCNISCTHNSSPRHCIRYSHIMIVIIPCGSVSSYL